MAITNLAKTKWTFNATPTLSDLGTFAVNFNSNNTDYTSLTVSAERMKYGDDLAYGEPEPTYPVKGDLITMNVDGTDKQFRVLKINGSVAEVMHMSQGQDRQQFGITQIYANSLIDTYLNETYYATLTETAKSAIVDKTFTQDSWCGSATGNPVYSCTSQGAGSFQISLGSATFGSEITRHIYIISVQDIIDYLGATPQMTYTDTTITSQNLYDMFMSEQITVDRVSLLRSARADNVNNIEVVFLASGQGFIGQSPSGNQEVINTAFTIDLSKIDFSIST